MSFWKRILRAAPTASPAPASEFTVEREIAADGSLRLTTAGVADKGSRELRIDGVPERVVDVTEALLVKLAELAAREGLTQDGETLGGPLLHGAQPVIHASTLRVASRTSVPGADEIFRVVDWNEPVDGGFPARLVATHLALSAEQETRRRRRLELLRWSVELYPGSPAATDESFSFERGENIGNWLGWSLLGETLVECGSIEEGLRAIEQAVLRCPAWAADFAKHVASSIERTGASPDDDPRLAFWTRYAQQMGK